MVEDLKGTVVEQAEAGSGGEVASLEVAAVVAALEGVAMVVEV